MPIPIHETQPSQEKHWFFSQLFKTLLITATINLILWGGVIAALPFFGPELENFLFPSVKQIQKIRSELDRVHVIQDEKSKELKALTEQTQKELAVLKESFNKLSDQVKLLHDRVSMSVIGLATPASSEIVAHWNDLLKQFNKGEFFEDQLLALKPFVKENKDILEAVHDLLNVASKKTRPFDKLAADLVLIKEKFVGQTQTSIDTENLSWFDKLWRKAKDHISFERSDQIVIPSHNSLKKEAIIESIDFSLRYIRDHNYEKAINVIKGMHAQPTFDQWIVDAELRLSVEQKVNVLKERIIPLLNKKVF